MSVGDQNHLNRLQGFWRQRRRSDAARTDRKKSIHCKADATEKSRIGEHCHAEIVH